MSTYEITIKKTAAVFNTTQTHNVLLAY